MSARKRQRMFKKMVDEIFESGYEHHNAVVDGCESESDTSINYENQYQDYETVVDKLDFSEFDYVSSDNEIDECLDVCAQTLKSELASWASKTRLPRDSTNELLGILRNHGIEVPKDSRTLLKTPRSVEVLKKCGGTYFYFGIRNGICSAMNFLSDPVTAIELAVNVDGLPLEKSTSSQFWPILGSINFSEHVFIIAIFHGYSKPDSVEEFLNDFILEATDILQNGLLLRDEFYPFSIKCFICDAPARAFMKCIIGHCGYNACERCEIVGERVENRTVFNKGTYEEKKRTGQDFSAGNYLPNHQKEMSPLLQLGIDCVDQFPLDYMHLVCLGVTKRILMFLMKGPNVCRLSHNLINQISDRLILHNGLMPSDFNRQPRPLSDLCHWKSTEFRQFILYHGPVVLRGIVDSKFYDHFLLLHVAMSLLLKSQVTDDDVNEARDHLKNFVKFSKIYYGSTFNVYNIHSLPHIADDADRYGSLNNVNAFKYENFMQELKKNVRNGTNHVAQIVKRMSERSSNQSNPVKIEKKLKEKLKPHSKNSFFFDTNGDLGVTQHVGEVYVDCKIISRRRLYPFYENPVDSRHLGIFQAKNFFNLESERRLIHHSSISKKAIRLPYKDDFVFFPLLHFFGESKF
ncbi:uncharacterized protein [Clytia hemisphaerica]